MDGYHELEPYFGDLHSHCAVGYGHGSLEEAFRNARMQLDFAAVTVHAHWNDLPARDGRLDAVVDYHEQGFARAASAWANVKRLVDENYVPGQFVTFLAFEWHSLEFGDHNVYFKGAEGDIIRATDLEDMRRRLRDYQRRGIEAFLIPHHIGYKQGYRGINWATFTPEFSPIVEIMSMHGASESPDAPYPYLHTMGPRDWRSTWQYGLAQGHIAGVMGSTDHHSAHPGSYGHGRLCVWANRLDRDGIWDAIRRRRTVALTGDNIRLRFSVDGEPLGALLSPRRERHLQVDVEGGSAIDYVDVLHNNRVIHRENVITAHAKPSGTVIVHFEVGWAEKHEPVTWDVRLRIENGSLARVEPRFRGHEIVAPQATQEDAYAFSDWCQPEQNEVAFTTRTWGNLTTSTASTQGVSLTIDGDTDTTVQATINGLETRVRLADLAQGPVAGYLGGFLTPAYCFQRAVPRAEFATAFELDHASDGTTRDWYYVRVRQRNNQWAWSSPIWVDRA